MTRGLFGGTISDYVINPYDATTLLGGTAAQLFGYPTTPVTITFWSAPVGGVLYTDLLLPSGGGVQATTSVNGVIQPVQGPDGVARMWADAGNGRTLMVASNAIDLIFAAGGIPNAALLAPLDSAAMTGNFTVNGQTIAQIVASVIGSSSPVVTASAPGVPGITANVATPGSVLLAWTAPSSNGGAAISTYSVYVDNALVTSAQLPGSVTDTLSAGAHTAYVTVTNSAGTTGSTVISFTVAAIPTASAPGAPTLAAANVATALSAKLTWAAGTAGSAATSGYNLYVDGGLVYSGTALTYTASLSAASHTAYVTAYNSVGTSVSSNTVAFTVSAGTAAAPSAPTSVVATSTSSTTASLAFVPAAGAAATSFTVTAYPVPGLATGLTTSAVTSSNVTLSWTAPSGATITGWQLWWTTGGTSYTTNVLPASTSSYTYTSLNAGSPYTLAVAAINGPATGARATTTVTTLSSGSTAATYDGTATYDSTYVYAGSTSAVATSTSLATSPTQPTGA